MENIIVEKSKAFALRIIKLYKYLDANHRIGIISTQILKSGTSIGANVSEAQKSQSHPDFNAKMNIALKEANETYYWLRLLFSTEYLNEREFKSIESDIDEIISILVSICKKTNI